MASALRSSVGRPRSWLPRSRSRCSAWRRCRVTKPAITTACTYRQDIPANQGFAAAERHFSQSRLQPGCSLVEADHDMRNSADFLILNRLAKAVFKIKGISRVQGITRPEGTPIARTSIPFMLSLQNASQTQTMKFQEARINDLLKQADDLATLERLMQEQYGLLQKMNEIHPSMIGEINRLEVTVNEIRDSIADFDDFFRPIRNYFYWEPHCYDIPICHSLRSIFDSMDGIDELTETLRALVANVDELDRDHAAAGGPVPAVDREPGASATMMLTHAQHVLWLDRPMDASTENVTAMGRRSTRPRTTTLSICRRRLRK